MDSALVNPEGIYQLVDPHSGELLGLSVYVPSQHTDGQVQEHDVEGVPILIAHAWLNETDWYLTVQQPASTAYGAMYQTRRVIIAASAVFVALIGFVVWFTIDRFLRGARATAESRAKLQVELIHAAKLASVGELAAGIAHEINNPLAVIRATSGVIQDYFDPQFDISWTPEMLKQELATIDTAVSRAHTITRKLLTFSRKNPPELVLSDVNRLLDDVVEGLKEHEFLVSDINLVRDYDLDLPQVMLDRDQMTQVFLNLINNAGDAVDVGGTITLRTHREEGTVCITVMDTGAGMASEVLRKVFQPFFTTKEVGKGTGLGLSISLSIVESMGGSIEIQSMPGSGSSVTVVLPLGDLEVGRNEAT